MEFIPVVSQGTIFMQLTLAMALGLLLGAERSIAGKSAGMRTYALVSLGACMFVIISTIVSAANFSLFTFDPLRVTAGIVTGVGFLGAGLIVLRESQLRGLTTAAGLWVAAGIGVATGFQLYNFAIFATFLTLIVFTIMWFAEEKIKILTKSNQQSDQNKEETSQ